jgi:trk system potassium uptake protein
VKKGRKYTIALRVMSRNLFIMSGALFINIGIAIIYAENLFPFIISTIVALTVGVVFYLFSRHQDINVTIRRKEAYATVTLSWLVICLIGSLPYIISGAIPSITDAVFESVSGFTTTGSSILQDIESLPMSILFWRSMSHWIGGIGIIVLVIIVMPTLQIGGYHLFTTESSLQDKIQPKIRSVGIRLLMIYILLTAVETIFLLLGGMDLFMSVCHSFGTVSTGGFSPRNTSIAEYAPFLQYVIMVFMLLSGINFVIHYYLVKKNFSKIIENEEMIFYLAWVIFIGAIITLALHFNMQKPVEVAFREGFFQVISVITCTGYASADFMLWPEFAWILIFFAFFLGGSTGSTSGGIKMVRHLLLYKNVIRSFQRLLYPHAVLPVRLNNKVLDEDTNNSALTFISNYFLVFALGSLILILFGNDAATACSSVATSMANIGPGLGEIGPAGNFAHLSDTTKIILSFLMIVGRLEIYTILILFTPGFWRS